MSSGLLVFFGGCWLAVGPGGVFVVEGVVVEAAVEDADEAVGEGAQGLVMQVARGSPLDGRGNDRRGTTRTWLETQCIPPLSRVPRTYAGRVTPQPTRSERRGA